MQLIDLSNIVYTKISYEMSMEDAQSFSLEIKNELTLRLPKDADSKSFMLTINTSVVEPNKKAICIEIVANAFFEYKDQIDSFDEIIKNECFPKAFSRISDTIDQILAVLNYPKLNISIQ